MQRARNLETPRIKTSAEFPETIESSGVDYKM